MTPREQQLIAQLEQCQQALAMAQRENLLLRQKIDALARRIFGVSSEALDPAQLQLLLQMPELKPLENPPAPVVVVRRKPRSHGPASMRGISDVRSGVFSTALILIHP